MSAIESVKRFFTRTVLLCLITQPAMVCIQFRTSKFNLFLDFSSALPSWALCQYLLISISDHTNCNNSCIWAHDFQLHKAPFDIWVQFIRFLNSKVIWTQLDDNQFRQTELWNIFVYYFIKTISSHSPLAWPENITTCILQCQLLSPRSSKGISPNPMYYWRSYDPYILGA